MRQLAEAALADPPDDAGVEKMAPNAEERRHYENVKRLRREEPDSPLLAALREKIAELDSIRMAFTAEKIVFSTPSGTNVERYRVAEELPDQLVLETEGKGPPEKRHAIVRFMDDDHIVLALGARRVPFERVGAAGVVSAGRAAAGPAGAAGGVPQGLPAKTGDPEFDGCVADYFACVAKMPPDAQDAMKDSLDLLKLRMHQAAQDPEERKSFARTCNDLLKLIRSTALCQ
jgi:hypothetical protein